MQVPFGFAQGRHSTARREERAAPLRMTADGGSASVGVSRVPKGDQLGQPSFADELLERVVVGIQEKTANFRLGYGILLGFAGVIRDLDFLIDEVLWGSAVGGKRAG